MCQRRMVLELRLVRNLEAEPEVVDEIRQGIVFAFVCGHCHSTKRVQHALLMYHPRQLPAMVFVPPPGLSRRDSRWAGSDLAQLVREAEAMTDAPHIEWGELDAIVPIVERWIARPTPNAEEAVPPEEPLPDDLPSLFARIRERLDPTATTAGQMTQVSTSLAELHRARERFGAADDQQRIEGAIRVMEELRVAVELTHIEELIDPEQGATPASLERALARSIALEDLAEGNQRAHVSIYRGLALFKVHPEKAAEAIAIVEATLPALRDEPERTWLATALNNLALMYWDQRHSGDHDEWIEKAIGAGEEALALPELSHVDKPRDRARRAAVLGNLSSAYGSRAAGHPVANETRSLELAEQALELLDPHLQRHTVALLHNNIGMHYLQTQSGDRYANIEKARESLELAASGLRREQNPAEWAMVQNNLGICHSMRYAGNRERNIEKAFTHFGNAMSAARPQDGLAQWAQARLGVATTLLERDLEPAERFEQQAIELMEEVLAVTADNPDEQIVAECHQQLATLYGRKVNEGAAEYAERAMDHVARASAYYDRESYARNWGVMRSGLSLVKAKMAEPDRPGALAAAEEAIEALPRDRFPFEWGVAQLNKAIVHQILGDLDQAVRHGEFALTELTPARFPSLATRVASMLGECHGEAGRWPEATAAFREAVNACRYAYEESLRSSARTDLFRQAGIQHTSAAYAAARAGDMDQAIVLAEEGRAFALREALELDPATVDPTVDHTSPGYQTYLQALERMRTAEAAIRAPWLAHARTTTQLARLDADQRQTDLEEARRAAAEARGGLTTRQPRDIAAIRRYADGMDAVVYVLSTSWGSVMLTLRPETGEMAKRESPLTHERLSERLFRRDGLLVGAMVGGELVREAIADLQRSHITDWLREGLRGAGTVMMVPMGPWSAVPFNAFTDDQTVLVHAVSAEVRHHCRTRLARGSGRQPGVLAYADPSLPLAGREAAEVGDGRVIPPGSDAKQELLAALPRYTHLHLATHGVYSLEEPAESAIRIGADVLSLRELIGQQLLKGVRLVFLSACQTGISDILSARDEVVGLPSACIYSGAIGVVGTLWPVDDTATYLLVRAFYRAVAEAEPPVALAQARHWLRNVTAGELLSESVDLPDALGYLRLRAPGDRPFHDPFFWAPFIYVGA